MNILQKAWENYFFLSMMEMNFIAEPYFYVITKRWWLFRGKIPVRI